jgi:pSer/pThr/pTyr-binding forkhead associated (FHA) protein
MEKLTLKGVTHPGDLELSEGMVSLGRNPTNDFRVSDPTVSSFHCELIVAGGTVLVRDLNSTNGTYVDNESIQESFLRPGQTLRLGQAELRLELAQAQEVVIAIPEIKVSQPETHLLDGRLA